MMSAMFTEVVGVQHRLVWSSLIFTVMQRLGLFSMIRTFICNSMIEDLERSRTIWTYQVWSDNLHIKIRSAWKRSGTPGVILCELAVSVRIERSARCMYLNSFCMSVSWMICFVILQADLCQPHLVSVVSICLFIKSSGCMVLQLFCTLGIGACCCILQLLSDSFNSFSLPHTSSAARWHLVWPLQSHTASVASTSLHRPGVTTRSW